MCDSSLASAVLTVKVMGWSRGGMGWRRKVEGGGGESYIYVMGGSFTSTVLAVEVKVKRWDEEMGWRDGMKGRYQIEFLKVEWRREGERWGGKRFIYGPASRVLAVKVKVNWIY